MSAMRRGMLMLEVMLGIAILGIAGVALVTLLTETLATASRGRAAEREVLGAAQLLDRATLWSNGELAMRLGRARVGAWDLEIAAPRARLYTLTVLDTLTRVVVLRTTVYRPAPANGN
ncbi:MAG TPA: type II secretion system protein [Gemmatimonadaceae bacterium]